MRVAVIGAGSMGMAFIRCWLSKEILKKENIVVIETLDSRIKELESESQLKIHKDLSLIDGCRYVFVAIKPQDFKAASKELIKHLKPDQIVVSIMAGVSIEKISSLLSSHKQIVRVMPNLPILVASGISAYYAAGEVDHLVTNVLEQLLSAGGEVMRLEKEDLMNAVTATSGSGPGYVFYILEHLMTAAKGLGFNDEQAKNLLANTVKGAVDLWQKDGRTADALCKAVTSKGGTTEAALSVFEKNNLGQVLVEGMKNAEKRAEELSKNS